MLDTVTTASSRRVFQTVRGQRASDGDGVKLTRILDPGNAAAIDPLLMLDEFKSDEAADYIGGFPPHPHRGFETVTYMLAGRMQHKDNRGNSGDLGPGSVQWMTAGRGIVHSEMPQQEQGLMWGFQLWINLPSHAKMSAPAYQDIPAEQIPNVELAPGVSARVIVGSLNGVAGPVHAEHTDARYYDYSLAPGTAIDVPLPATHTAVVYCFQGSLAVGTPGTVLPAGELGFLSHGASIHLATTDAAARCLVIAGQPLGEPIAHYGPFVMNTRAEIEQAVQDFQSGNF